MKKSQVRPASLLLSALFALSCCISAAAAEDGAPGPDEDITIGETEIVAPQEPAAEDIDLNQDFDLNKEQAEEFTLESEPVESFDGGLMYVTPAIRGRIDPFDIMGRGQIDYEDVEIRNGNAMPVRVLLSEVSAEMAGVCMKYRPLDRTSDEKSVFLYLSGDASYSDDQILRPGPCDADYGVLAPGDTMTLRIQGEANTGNMFWSAEDYLHLSLRFSFQPEEEYDEER